VRIKLIPLLVILTVLIGVCSASAQLKKVRFSTTGISVSELPFKVAQLKGFWREELRSKTLFKSADGLHVLSLPGFRSNISCYTILPNSKPK